MLLFVLSVLILNVFMCEMRRLKVSNYGHTECIVCIVCHVFIEHVSHPSNMSLVLCSCIKTGFSTCCCDGCFRGCFLVVVLKLFITAYVLTTVYVNM